MEHLISVWGFPGGASSKEPTCQCRRQTQVLFLGLGRSSGRGHGNPTPVFLPGESHGHRSVAGYSLWGCKESDMTEVTWHAHSHCLLRIAELFGGVGKNTLETVVLNTRLRIP